MSAFSSGFKRIIALFGLVAVLLGALEHEDLIFQHTEIALATDRAASAAAILAESNWSMSTESGTEGTFRAETHRLWLSPKPETRFAGQLLRATHPVRLAAFSTSFRRERRPPLVGIVALRL
jgi:hypothetical protein